MVTQSADIRRIIAVRLNPGDDILDGLNEAVHQEGVRNGVIINGLGSSAAHHYHVVASTTLPPAEAFPNAEEARDIVSFSGLIIGGRIHAHICFTDEARAEGGHLEPGTRALTFAIVVIADLGDDVDFAGWDSITDL
jgi:hypothetical protein